MKYSKVVQKIAIKKYGLTEEQVDDYHSGKYNPQTTVTNTTFLPKIHPGEIVSMYYLSVGGVLDGVHWQHELAKVYRRKAKNIESLRWENP